MNNLTRNLKANTHLTTTRILVYGSTFGRTQAKIIHSGSGLGSITSYGILEPIDHSLTISDVSCGDPPRAVGPLSPRVS